VAEFRAEMKDLSFLQSIQINSGVHRVSYIVNSKGSLFGGKAVGAWSWPQTRSYSCRKSNRDVCVISSLNLPVCHIVIIDQESKNVPGGEHAHAHTYIHMQVT